MRTRILALLPLLASSLLYAQSQYAQITATNITDAAGNKLVSGSITFTPVNNAGTPIAPHATTGGRVVPRPVVFKVVNGVITPSYGTAQLVDVTQTNPVNICYADRIHDNLSGDTWSPDPCVQPAYNASWCSVSNGVTTCNFDNYQPTSTPGVIVQTGPAGPAGPAGAGLAGLTGDGTGNVTVKKTLTADAVVANRVEGALAATSLTASGDVRFTGSVVMSGGISMTAMAPSTNPICIGTDTHLTNIGCATSSGSYLPLTGGNVNGNTSLAITNNWERNVCSYSDTLYPTHGDKLRACNADAVAAGGGTCDSRCIQGTGLQTTGSLPIELGTPTTPVLWRLPDVTNDIHDKIKITQSGNNLPTPAAITPVATVGGGTLPAATYYVQIAYASGDGKSAASAETSVVLSAAGSISVASPPSTAYSYTYDVFISTASGAETWQANYMIGTTSVFSAPLLVGYEAPPTAPTGIPAIIVHGHQGGGIISDAATGYRLWTASTTNVSNLIATEDEGNPVIKGVKLDLYDHLGTVNGALVLLKGIYSQTNIDNIQGYGLAGVPMIKIVSANDVTFNHINVGCHSLSGCTAILLDNRYVNGDFDDSLRTLTFVSPLMTGPAPNGVSFQVNGNTAGNQKYAEATGITMINPSFENSGGSANVTAIKLTDTGQVNVISPDFEFGATGYIPVSISESNPCQLSSIRISDARLATPDGGLATFVHNTADQTGDVIVDTSNGAVHSYYFGANQVNNCPQPTEYRRGVQVDSDTFSVGGNAATALVANAPSVFSTNGVANPGFETGTDTLGAGWIQFCKAGATCTFTRSTTTPHSGSYSQEIAIGNSGYGDVEFAPLTLVAGTVYTLSFWARGDGSANQLTLSMEDTTGEINYCPVQVYGLNTTWTQYIYHCTALFSGSGVHLMLGTYSNAGAYGVAGSMWVDDVFFGVTSAVTFPAFGAASSLGATGDGTVAMTGSGSYTANNLLVADSHGNSVDSGVPAASLGGSAVVTPTGAGLMSMTNSISVPYASGLITDANNRLMVYPWYVPTAFTFNKVNISVQTAGSSSTSDVCIYSWAGALLASTGGFASTSTGYQQVSISGGSKSLSPGWYLFGQTTNVDTLKLLTQQQGITGLVNQSGNIGYGSNAAVGGVCPATIGSVTSDTTDPPVAAFFHN